MLQKLKINLLVPLEYDKGDYGKSLEENIPVSRELAEQRVAEGAIDSPEWFHYCFRPLPISESDQLANSPLVRNTPYQISRIELDSNSFARNKIGLDKRENTRYTLRSSISKNANIDFQIRKIRILFTKSRLAFLHMEIVSENISTTDARLLIYALSKIRSKTPSLQYTRKLSRDESEDIIPTLRQLIDSIVGLQKYIPLKIYEDRGTIRPYFQIYMAGVCDKEDRENFFDSIRALSNSASENPIGTDNLYQGKDKYIFRFAGNHAICIFGDIEACVDDTDASVTERNLKWLTDNGSLIKSGTENYLTVYVSLLSLHLLTDKTDTMNLNSRLDDSDLDYLLNSPEQARQFCPEEENIHEFFQQCLWDHNWELGKSLAKIKEAVREGARRDDAEKFKQDVRDVVKEELDEHKRYQAERFNQLDAGLENAKAQEEAHHNSANLQRAAIALFELDTNATAHENLAATQRLEASFTAFFNSNNSYMASERERLMISGSGDEDERIAVFNQNVSERIKGEVLTNQEFVEKEKERLFHCMPDIWEVLLPDTRLQLASGELFYHLSEKFIPRGADFSGVCIQFTTPLEAELKRIFLKGFIAYMKSHYGTPGKGKNSEDIYEKWPDELLTVPKGKNNNKKNKKKPKIDNGFAMGKLPFLFGKLNKDDRDYSYQQEQSKKIQDRMTEYLKEIVKPEYQDDPLHCFYIAKEGNTKIRPDCIVGKCEQFRTNYRNKTAHTDVMTWKEAVGCRYSVLGELEQASGSGGANNSLNAAGLLREIYDIIDVNELDCIIDPASDNNH